MDGTGGGGLRPDGFEGARFGVPACVQRGERLRIMRVAETVLRATWKWFAVCAVETLLRLLVAA